MREHMNNDNNFCPILSLKGNTPGMNYCEKDRCAWWNGGRCAVLEIAECLSSMDENGLAVF